MTKFAWCTLVIHDEGYARAAVLLSQSLRNVKTVHPVYCLYSDISQDCVDVLSRYFTKCIPVPKITKECRKMHSAKQQALYGKWINFSFTKWNVLNPAVTGADKCILLDADMLFLENCDDLFDLTAPAMTFSSPWAKPYVPNGINNEYWKTNKRNLRHGEKVEVDTINRAFCSSFLGLSCMVLVAPNDKLFKLMLQCLNRHKVYGWKHCINGFDEQLFAETIIEAKLPCSHIDPVYNAITGKDNWLGGAKPKTRQWYGDLKPWRIEKKNARFEDEIDWWHRASLLYSSDPALEKWFAAFIR